MANGKTRRVMSREEFRLLHYAGEVNYNVNGRLSFSSPVVEMFLLKHQWPQSRTNCSLVFLFLMTA